MKFSSICKGFLIFCLFSFCFFSCKEPTLFLYDFYFTPPNISKFVNSSFNIFDLSFKTNLPSSITDDMHNYDFVDIEVNDKSLVSIFDNCITTLAVGSTRVNIVITYDNQNIDTYFDLTIVSEDIPPEEEIKPSVPSLTFLVDTYIDEDYIDYTLYIYKDEKPYSNFKVVILNEDIENLIEFEYYNRNIYTLSVNDFIPIYIEILDLMDNTNIIKVVLSCN